MFSFGGTLPRRRAKKVPTMGVAGKSSRSSPLPNFTMKAWQIKSAVCMIATIVAIRSVHQIQTSTNKNVHCKCKDPAVDTRSSSQQANRKELTYDYTPASTEAYLVENMKKLQLDGNDRAAVANYQGCPIWKNKTVAPEIFDDLHSFRKDLQSYHSLLSEMESLSPIMDSIQKHNNYTVCDAMRLHPEGLPGVFPSKQLSHGDAGYAEPLLTPMRHPDFCFSHKALFNMNYLVLDYEKMCRDLKPHSRTVLIDLGASLTFGGKDEKVVPIMYLLHQFEKHGFKFDHVYAVEVTFQDPSKVYRELLPAKYFDSYHWINTGVSGTEGDKMNPWENILHKFTPDDLVIVKLDIDTASIENPLAYQLLHDESRHEIVDHFFFEHHVLMKEIWPWFKRPGVAEGSVKSSFDLFQGLRKKGIMSHFWV